MRAKLGAKVTGNFRKSVEREIKKFRGDHYLWHKHVTGINLNPHQVNWMNDMDKYGDSHMLIGSRRIRKSFTVAAYFLEEAMCLPYSEVNIHSPALEQSKRNMRYIHDMVMNSDIALAYLDERLGEGLGKEHVEFMNRSLIQAKGQASSVDGLGATHQWLEEFDDMDWDSFLTRIYPTGSQIKDAHHYQNHTGCCRVITGTIKGIGNIYRIEHPDEISGSSKLKFNVLTKLTCFVPETLILTDRGPVKIIDVKIDDKVITENGQWKPVKQLHTNDYDDDLIEIKMAYGSGIPVLCTKNHKFYTNNGEIRADELKIGDIIKCHDKVPEIERPKTDFEITNELAYLMGLYLADGSYGPGQGTSGGFISICFNKKDLTGIQRAYNLFKTVFKKDPTIREDRTATNVYICGNRILDHFYKYCGEHSRKKLVHPSIEHFSDELKRQFLLGYFSGDGCEQKNSNGNHTSISSKTVNQGIAVSISRLLIQLGVRPTLNQTAVKENILEGRILKATTAWRVQTERIHKIDDIGLNHHGKQKLQTGSVVSIKRIKYSGKVYNLGVEDIHSYTLGSCGARVTNCWHGVAMGIIPENDIYLFQALSTPHQFARTYLVLYVESSSFYPERWIRNCADNEYLPIDVIIDINVRYKAQGVVTIGIDCAGAGSGQDASCWSVTFTEKIGNQIFWLYSKEWSANERPDKVITEIVRLLTFFRPQTGFGDAFDTAFLFDLNRAALEAGVTRIDVRKFENKQGANGWEEWYIKPLRFGGPQKHIMHERMQKYVYGCLFRYPAIVEDDPRYTMIEKLTRQLGNIKAERSLAGYNKYSMLNTKLGDDTVDSCIASIWAQQEIVTLTVPVGGFVPQMEFSERYVFQKLGPKFLADTRKHNKPGSDNNLLDFMKS